MWYLNPSFMLREKVTRIFGLSISHSIDRLQATDLIFCFPMQLEQQQAEATT
jgi:hypothetical protein